MTAEQLADRAQRVADLMHAALAEVDPDLAVGFAVFVDVDGTPYAQPFDDLTPGEVGRLEQAERLALAKVLR